MPIVIAAAALTPLAALAQAAPAPSAGASAKKWTTPRTPWGEPDLQGTYSNRTITPFERPATVGGREFFTAEEAAALEKRAQEQSGDEGRSKGTRGDVERAYNDFWWDRGTKVTSLRTSLVVDPPDGKVPALTAEAQKRAADEPKRPAFRGAGASGRGADSWLDRSTFERCITRGMPGAMSPTAYNNNYRITQGPGFVAIQIEMLGGARVIPTDGRPHVGKSIRQWMGDSVARWDGDTLVVETAAVHRQGAVSRRRREPAPGRALHPRRPGRDRLPRDHHRSDHVHEAVDARDSLRAHRRGPVRVRVPRGQLRHGGHPQRRPRGRARRGRRARR